MSAPESEDPMPSSTVMAVEDIRKTDPPPRGNPLLRYLRPAQDPRPANDNRQPEPASATPETETPTA